MVDLTFIKENSGQVFVRDTKLIYQYSKLTNAWATAGVVNENIESAYAGLTGLIAKYDSSFNSLEGSLIAQLTLVANDSDGNSISWVATSDDPLVTISGSSPSFSFMPRKEIGDDNNSAGVSFVGTINSGDSAPKFKSVNIQEPVPAGFTADSLGIIQPNLTSLDISYSYNWQSASLAEYNHEVAVDISSFSIPNIQYIKKGAPTTSSTKYNDVKFEENGTLAFFLNDLDDKIFSYTLTTPYDINTFDATTEKSFSLVNDDIVQFTSANALEFSPSGKKLFIADKTKDKIVEFTLDTPYDLHSIKLKENFITKANHFKDEDAFISPDGKYYYSMIVPSRLNVGGSNFMTAFPTTFGTITRRELHDSGDIYSLKGVNDSNGAIPAANTQSFKTDQLEVFKDGVPYSSVTASSGGTWYGIPIYDVWGEIIGYNYYAKWYHFGSPQAFCFNNAGTKLYTATTAATTYGLIRQYCLDVPWDLTSVSNEAIVSGYDNGGTGNSVKHEFGYLTTDQVRANSYYYHQANPQVSSLGQGSHGIHSMKISVDGTKLYLYDENTKSIYQYNLSTSDDITCLSQTIKPLSKTFDAGGYDIRVRLQDLDSANSILGQELTNFSTSAVTPDLPYIHHGKGLVNSISLVDDSAPLSMNISTNRHIYKIGRSLTGDLTSTLQSSVTNQNLKGQHIVAVNPLDDKQNLISKLFVQSYDSCRIDQWELSTYNNLNTQVKTHTDKLFEIIASPAINPGGMLIDSDNSALYIAGDRIFKYDFTTDSGVSGMSFNASLQIDSIGSGITGMTFADSTGRIHTTSSNIVNTIELTDSFNNSEISSELFGIAAPIDGVANGIEWIPGGKKFILNVADVGGTTNNTLEAFSTKNVFSVKST